ncbi:MAG TPA: MFS transporter [Streptosporangiaceae bacterium]|nr:MFS transporter [Streptosporangiaceae bacterium]
MPELCLDQSSPAATRRTLWRQRDFLLLWSGQSISEFGSAVTKLALPLTAVVVLKASAFQVGLLSAATTVAFIVVALPAGVVVSRWAKRRLMLGCDAGRMLVIGSVPLAAAFGLLKLPQLYIAAVLTGLLSVFFDIAYQSYLPLLIDRDQLMDGNGKLTTSYQLAKVGGPGLGGALVGVLGAAGAMAVDAISFAFSAWSLLLIRAPEPRVSRSFDGSPRPAMLSQIKAGLGFLFRHPILRNIVACSGLVNLFLSVIVAVQIVFLIRVLQVSPAYTGLLLTSATLCGGLGGLAAGRLTRWVGSARIIWTSMLVFGATGLLIPLAEPGWRVILFACGWGGTTVGIVIYNVAQVSYRQATCSPQILSQVNATARWIVTGAQPVGGVLGGVLGATIGVRGALWVAAAGAWAAGLLLFFSPLRKMRDVPDTSPPDHQAGDPEARRGDE